MINLVWLAINHLLVDLVSAYLVIGSYFFHDITGRDFFILVLIYGIIAFALQPLFGRLIDWSKNPYKYLLTANILILAALLLNNDMWLVLPIIVAGLGNALFHVAAGTVALNIESDKAWPLGILVGPGELGLFIGGWLAKNQVEWSVFLMLAMVVNIVIISYLPRLKIDYTVRPLKNTGWLYPVLTGLLLIVGMRAVIGFSLFYDWKTQLGWLVLLVLAVTAGKMAAGFIADRWGWKKMSLIMVGLSLPLLVLGFKIPALAILGAFCFQITMPVTLAAVARLQSGYPGWAFGLPCFLLIVGAILAFFIPAEWLTVNVGWLIAGQIIVIYWALTYFNKITTKTNA